MKLSQKIVNDLALPVGKKDLFVFDDACPGFGCRVQGNRKSFVLRYRHGAKQRSIVIATAAMPLAEARKIAVRLHAEIRLGRDPQAEREAARVEPPTLTFEAALEPFLKTKRAKLRRRSYAEVERHLCVYSKPLHKIALSKIGRAEITALRVKIDASSGTCTANAWRVALSSFFGSALRAGLIDANPVLATDKPDKQAARTRVLVDSEMRDLSELRDLWRALGENDNDYSHIVKLLLLTGARRTEISDLRWSEVDFNLDMIKLPASRVKNKRPFEIPMSAPVREILQRRPRGEDRDFVFGRTSRGFSGFSESKRVLDKRLAELRAREGRPSMQPFVLHDLRRSMVTLMCGHPELQIAPHIVESCVNHASGHKAGIAAVYNLAVYPSQKRDAFNKWGAFVMRIAEGGVSNVIALHA